MSAQHWGPAVAFLAVAIPLVLLLNAAQLGGEFRVWIAMAGGALAAGITQARLAARVKAQGKEQ